MWHLARVLLVSEIYFIIPAFGIFNDKVTCESEVSSEGDIKIPPHRKMETI